MLQVFMYKTLRGDALSSELWAMMLGLQVAWELGYKFISLES